MTARTASEIIKILSVPVTIPAGTEATILRAFHTGGAEIRVTVPVTITMIVPAGSITHEDK